MNTHAKLAREMNQPEVAIEKAKSAIIAFQKSGDRRYQMQAKTVLASILRLRNEFKSAEQLVKESLFHAEQLNNRRGISDNRTKLARLYQQTGRFRLAFEQWQMVLSLNAELELFTNSADAYLWLINLHLTENNVSQAEIDLKILTQLYHEQPIAPINPILIEAQLIVSLFKEDLESSQSYLSALIGTDHDLINMYQGDVALLRGNSMAAELHYLEALIGINPMARFDQMVQVLNKLNALYASTQSPKLNANIQRTLRLKPFIYPIQKFQALSAQAADNPIKALSLMEELKLKAGDYWQYQDQILLESMQSP
jgi:tetratricopeptide (TPR) repeat protein